MLHLQMPVEYGYTSKLMLRLPSLMDTKRKRDYTRVEYSHDGLNFVQLSPSFTVSNTVDRYVGYRLGVFNFATISLGGQLLVKECVTNLGASRKRHSLSHSAARRILIFACCHESKTVP